MTSQSLLDVRGPIVPGKSRPRQQSSENLYIFTLDIKGCICNFKVADTLLNPGGRYVDDSTFILNPAT